jgi:hypothetical protein
MTASPPVAYDRGDDRAALTAWLPLAEQGDADAERTPGGTSDSSFSKAAGQRDATMRAQPQACTREDLPNAIAER